VTSYFSSDVYSRGGPKTPATPAVAKLDETLKKAPIVRYHPHPRMDRIKPAILFRRIITVTDKASP